ncbi:putative transporter [Cyphellophora attinorum]|uniref:Putative transporter n=1 Tax=Cyphellophora attinorum TaxID=1664694 RepID=A0A0N1NVI1_9EURO|nr:putative transporter [Phialophora attinorum]KPI34386.1 putative transporter [Phialophora attinorum]
MSPHEKPEAIGAKDQATSSTKLASAMDDSSELKATIETSAGTVTDLDEAGIFLQQHNYTQAYLAELLQDADLNKRLVRKVDRTLMPLLCGTFFLQFIDKQALSYSAVFDLFPSTGITQTEYSWLASIFYMAYLVAEWPSSYLAQRFNTSRVIAGFVTIWGCIMLLTVASHNFTGMAICRFFLGCFESVITPAFMMIVGMWYVKEQQPARAGIFYCFNGFGSAVGGLLFYGTGYSTTLAVWRTIYIICGGLTVVWGIVLFAFLPANIMSARQFTTEEKALLIARVQANRTGVYNRKIKVSHIIEALTDLQVWLLFLFVFANEVINGGISNFGKLIIKNVVKGDSLRTTAYGIPQGAFQVAWVFSGPYLASKIKNSRTVIMCLYLVPTIVGTTLLYKLPRTNVPGCLVSYYIIGSFVASLVLALQLPASNLGGYTKRVTGTAVVFLAYCAGNIVGPHAFLASEAPIYETGVRTVIGCSVAQFVLAVALRILLVSRNKRRDREAGERQAEGDEAGMGQNQGQGGVSESEVLDDLTDFQNRRFRYTY